MKQFVVVAYDVADDRRRQKIAKVLVGYGIRCNESVFECLLTEPKIRNMQQQLLKLADESEDIILYYFLCKPCVMKRESVGRRTGFEPEIIMV
ncbi:MAG: CRISPR-associated endonuclease Cas2 [Prolixibacteraceae bacterium]|nr:CRISPR-associated endonuclease Cas2 [Prolixibacteraceae bacterium]